MPKAKVVLFKKNGKYYTEEEWEIPAVVKDHSDARGDFEREPLLPFDMSQSKDFRRINDGPVLVITQEPWGYPCLLVKFVVEEVK